MNKAIVVGSGAGGCAAAVKLSEHFEVTVLEAGKQFKPFGIKPETFEPLRRAGAFFNEGMISLLFPEMRILKTREGLVHVNGRGIGGTTTLATGNALRYDGALREIGIDLDAEFAELEREVPSTQEHYKRWSDLTVRLYEAFEELGFDPMVTPKFMEDANRCVACGRCVLGCRYGAKWTADKLLEAHPEIEVKSNCFVKGLMLDGDRVSKVVVLDSGRTQLLEADLVVLAAGGLGTPQILSASGIPTQATLFVDPVLCVATAWEGAGLDAQLPMPFVAQREEYILSPYFDWLSFFFNKDWRMPAGNIMSIMIKYADSSEGSYNGARLYKPTTEHDEKVLRDSLEDAFRIFEHIGVDRKDTFLGTLNAGHPGGCLPLGEAEAKSLHHDVLPHNLYVADASLLPRSMGNPPILTIMALAKAVAARAAERIT